MVVRKVPRFSIKCCISFEAQMITPRTVLNTPLAIDGKDTTNEQNSTDTGEIVTGLGEAHCS